MASPAGNGFETDGLARSVGVAHLFLAGVTNVASGAILVGLSVSGRLLPAVIDGSGRYVSPATALRYGGLLAAVATDGALVFGTALVCFGVLACVVSWRSLRRGRSWRPGLALAVASGLNPLALPLSFVATTLLVVTRTEFTDGGDARTAGGDAKSSGESRGNTGEDTPAVGENPRTAGEDTPAVGDTDEKGTTDRPVGRGDPENVGAVDDSDYGG